MSGTKTVPDLPGYLAFLQFNSEKVGTTRMVDTSVIRHTAVSLTIAIRRNTLRYCALHKLFELPA